MMIVMIVMIVMIAAVVIAILGIQAVQIPLQAVAILMLKLLIIITDNNIHLDNLFYNTFFNC